MKKSKQKNKISTINKQSGITLIALVITIIVLLILAGIAIATLTGDDGLFSRAQQAKERSDRAQALENAALADYEGQMYEYGAGSQISQNSFTNVDIKETNPAGAAPINARVYEPDANKGIVIKDSKDNEWVWIEVPKTTVFTSIIENDENYYKNIKNALETYANAYQNEKYEDTYYEGCGVKDESEYKELYNKMLNSIYTNGGFWISRYEIGDKESTKSNSTRTDSKGNNTGANNTPVSKPDQIPYNYITQSQAQSLAKQMSTDESKTSSLLFGIQWDLVLKYLEVKLELESDKLAENSAKWGNYTGKEINITSQNAKQNTSPGEPSSFWGKIEKSKTGTTLLTTGASDDTRKMNIYDLAGNVWEWTLEKSNVGTYCTHVGGSYVSDSSDSPVTCRTEHSDSYIDHTRGFRTTLY